MNFPTPTPKAQRIRQICEEATALCWANTPPTPQYAARVVQLMCATWAHESDGGKYARQMRYNPNSIGGAAGEFQMEISAVRDCLRYINAWPNETRYKIANWLFDDPTPVTNWNAFIDELTAYKMLVLSDKWAALLARIYYLQRPGAVPAGLVPQSEYAKRYWNTTAGKATPQDYADKFRDYFGEPWV